MNEDFPWEETGNYPHAHAAAADEQLAQKDVGELNRNTVGVGHASMQAGAAKQGY